MQRLLPRASLHGFGALIPLGMGATNTNQVIGGATGAVAALSPLIASDVGLTALIGASAAIPIIGAGIAALGFGIELIVNSGCGQPCIVTTQWANQAESALQQNIQEYFNIPAPRPQSVQLAALANFNAIWQSLVNQCNSPSLGAPGQRCITDRQAGSCKWHQATTPPWGSPKQGECWNWFSGYKDPIANDPNVVPDSQLAAQSMSVSSGGVVSSSIPSSFPSWIPLAGAAALLLFAAVGD